jgi:lipid A 3-O-deacylase
VIAKYQAEGWGNQLGTEPTLQLSYQQKIKFFELQHENGDKFIDAIPFFGGGFGNVSMDAHLGGMIRLGSHLPRDFGPTRPSLMDGDNFVTPIAAGVPESNVYVFAAGRGVAVIRNIFLDGNTFRSSHRVKKYPFFLETEFGAVGVYKQWSLAWRFVTRSPEFEERSVVNSFASISMTYAY